MTADQQDAGRPLVVGHRGASARAPENTLAAFGRALRDGADGVEFDVRLAADGVPVVVHDATLRRTALRGGAVSSHTSAELARLDAGTWFNRRRPARAREEFSREGIPTLARVLQLFAPRFRALYVELKCERAGAAALAEAVVAAVGETGSHAGRIVIESFDLGAVAEAKRLAPHLRAAALFERRLRRPLLPARELIARALGCGASELALHRSLATRGRVEAARAAGLQTVVWTVDHPSWAARAFDLGLRALITNDPARMRRALDAAEAARAGAW
ncbi:MAG: glycerophosphodiester phosphodiesterase [Acidobacteria bacterium]|nr:glycerophosphodiester phosphodiesterase [Acidobacteriota bacterium]